MPNIKNQGGIKMRINNNLMAMNAYRQLGITNNAAAKAMEKLSSGYRINRAGDDAAGLAISEKMRGQIRGLNMASKNAQDGISLIQTAEGALQETHAILQRMRELAVQAANDTNIQVDRSEIQKEINELIDEIDRISRDTEFNAQKLLNGEFTNKKFHIGANTGQDITLTIGDMSAGDTGLGVASLKVENVDKDTTSGGIMTQAEASAAIETIQNAIEKVSAERSKLGAYQNRLEHTIKNLDTSAENLQAAESRIRDVDYAEAA